MEKLSYNQKKRNLCESNDDVEKENESGSEYDDVEKENVYDQLFKGIEENFECRTYAKNKEIRDIEERMYEYKEQVKKKLKELIIDEDMYNQIIETLSNCDEEYTNQRYFWNYSYFKLGVKKGIQMYFG